MDEVIALDSAQGFGILTRAEGAPRNKTVVLLNAGLIHRIGPFRLHVHLARALAAEGFDVFRFDLPFVGDGPTRSETTEETIIGEVFSTLESITGGREFVIGGICSAADKGWRVAASDERVVGLLLLDGFAVKDAWFRVGQAELVLRRPPASWPGIVSRALRSKQADADGPQLIDFRDWPDHATFLSDLRRMLDRGVKILALYTGGVAYYLTHRRQLDSTYGALRRHPGLSIDLWLDADHILYSPVDRARAVDRIREWCSTL